MKFKIDENLPSEFAQLLRSVGHDAATVLEQAMSGASDTEVLSVCRSENRIIMTLDLDFADIRLYPPEETSGIIVFRMQSQDKEHLLRCLAGLIPFMDTEPLRGTLWIVEEDRLRIRNHPDA